jgi:hypothetical protein
VIVESKRLEDKKAAHEELSWCTLIIVSTEVQFTVNIPSPTFWEKTTGASSKVPSQIPAISKIIIALDQLNSIAFRQGQFVGTASREVI